MRYFALRYQTVPDFLERRGAHRETHLAQVSRFRDSGHLLLAGAFAEPADGALLIFRCPSRDDVEAFAKTDPYFTHGLVAAYDVREWTVVAGALFEGQ